MTRLRNGFLAALLAATASATLAQDWRGPVAIEAVVEDAKGKNVAGAEVRLVYLDPAGGGMLPSMLTDGDGKVSIGGLAAGRWVVEVRHAGHMTYRAEVALSASDRPDVLSAAQEMAPGAVGTLRVKLNRGKAGAPAPPARVAVAPPATPVSAPRPAAPSPAVAPAPAAPAPVSVASAPVTTTPAAPRPAPAPTSTEKPPVVSAPVRVAAEPAPAAAPTAAQPVAPAPATAPAAAIPAPTPAVTPSVAAKPAPVAPPVAEPEVVSPPQVAPVPAPSPAPIARPEAPTVAPAPEPTVAPAMPSTQPIPAGPPAAPAPEPVPTAAPIPNAAPAPRQRVCVECAPGEKASWGETSFAGGAAAGCPAELEEQLRTVSLSGGALEALPALAGTGCRVIRVDLPPGVRYTGFRYEASSRGVVADCLPGRECPAGAARFPSEPVLRKEGGRTTLLVGFESTAPDWRGALVAGYWAQGK